MKNTKNILLIILLFTSIFLIIYTINNQRRQNHLKKVNIYFNNALDAINEIHENLAELKSRESIIQRISLSNELNENDFLNPKEQIMLSISDINDYIAHNKLRLSSLENQLLQNNIQITSLQKMIDNLKTIIKDREDFIMILRTQVDELSEKIISERKNAIFEIYIRDTTIKEQKSTLQEKINELELQKIEEHTIYYIIAHQKDLIQNNFLTKSKLFSSPKLTNYYNTDIMLKLNLLEYHQIIIQSEVNKIKVLSNHDKQSYILQDFGTETLFKITDIELFKNIKYLIIQIS